MRVATGWKFILKIIKGSTFHRKADTYQQDSAKLQAVIIDKLEV